MEKEGENYFLNLLEATRLERALMPISFIMIPVAFANIINLDIFILMICCILMYCVGGLVNAKTDEDFELKKVNLLIIFLLGSSILLSFYNYIIFFAVMASLFMSFIYSKFSRFVLFGDSIALSITHVAIPILSASLILGLSINIFIPLVGFVVVPFWMITPMKNLRGIEEDKKRGYKTLMTRYKNGKNVTHILLSLYFIIIFFLYFLFNLGHKFLFIIFLMFVVKVFMDYYMNTEREVVAYGLVRLVIIMLPFAFVFDKALNIVFPLISSTFIFTYFLYFLKKVGGVKYGRRI